MAADCVLHVMTCTGTLMFIVTRTSCLRGMINTADGPSPGRNFMHARSKMRWRHSCFSTTRLACRLLEMLPLLLRCAPPVRCAWRVWMYALRERQRVGEGLGDRRGGEREWEEKKADQEEVEQRSFRLSRSLIAMPILT